MNINSSLTKELQDKAYRDAYVASQIRMVLPFQVRGLRRSRGLSQGELAALAGMAQPRISEIEKPGERSLNIDTLLRIALGLDVALQIRFVPFSELVSWSENFDPDNFQIPSFDDELAESQNAKTRPVGAYVLQQTTTGIVPTPPFTPEASRTLPLSILQAYGQDIAHVPTPRFTPQASGLLPLSTLQAYPQDIAHGMRIDWQPKGLKELTGTTSVPDQKEFKAENPSATGADSSMPRSLAPVTPINRPEHRKSKCRRPRGGITSPPLGRRRHA